MDKEKKDGRKNNGGHPNSRKKKKFNEVVNLSIKFDISEVKLLRERGNYNSLIRELVREYFKMDSHLTQIFDEITD